MRKFLTATLLATTILGAASPALAISDKVAAEHNALVSALQNAGISVHLDANLCRKRSSFAGFYHSPSKSLVICNKGSRAMNEENLDTLRHEAIHAIQDCKNGVQGDNVLHPVLKPGVVEYLAGNHGVDLDHITYVYGSKGASHEVIHLEHEAFTAAAGMSADTIASALRIMCSVVGSNQ